MLIAARMPARLFISSNPIAFELAHDLFRCVAWRDVLLAIPIECNDVDFKDPFDPSSVVHRCHCLRQSGVAMKFNDLRVAKDLNALVVS
jgi:hypothetical protein